MKEENNMHAVENERVREQGNVYEYGYGNAQLQIFLFYFFK